MVNYTLSLYTASVLGSDKFYGLKLNVFISLYRKLRKGKENEPKESDIRHQECAKLAEL